MMRIDHVTAHMTAHVTSHMTDHVTEHVSGSAQVTGHVALCVEVNLCG